MREAVCLLRVGLDSTVLQVHGGALVQVLYRDITIEELTAGK